MLCSFTYAVQSDFLIITNPDKLSILNHYEQPLSTSEKKDLLPYMPFMIVNQKEVLGDQITEAVRCKNLGNTYFLIKKDDGGFVSTANVTFQKLNGCTVLNDTAEVVKSFVLSQKFPVKGIETPISKGESVIRIFQNGTNIYVLTLGKNQYGWCTTPGVLQKTKKTEKAAKPADISDISLNIQRKIDNTNELYKAYFGYFNQLTNQQKSIPYWEMAKEADGIHCTLKGSQSTIQQMQSSTNYIVQDIEQLLLGKPFSVTRSGNQIIIVQR
jgi:hypothetical protein